MATIKDKIFPLFGAYDSRIDVNKDSNGKGTLERYNEALAEEYDEEFETLVTTIYENVKNPKSGYAKYLSSLELGKGNDYILPHTLPIRRDIQLYLKKYWQIKGTAAFLNAVLGLGGFAVTVTENYADYGFDSPVTFDDVDRKFDLGCGACSQYSVVISRLDGSTEEPSQSEWIFIESVIGINEPIDTKLKDLTFDAGITLDELLSTYPVHRWFDPQTLAGIESDNVLISNYLERKGNNYTTASPAKAVVWRQSLGINGRACFHFGVDLSGSPAYTQFFRPSSNNTIDGDFTIIGLWKVDSDYLTSGEAQWIAGGTGFGSGKPAAFGAGVNNFNTKTAAITGTPTAAKLDVLPIGASVSEWAVYAVTNDGIYRNGVELTYAQNDLLQHCCLDTFGSSVTFYAPEKFKGLSGHLVSIAQKLTPAQILQISNLMLTQTP